MPRSARPASSARREFLTRTTALGVSAAAAYALLGLDAPAQAQDAMTPTPGGTLRMNMETRAMKDPRTWDWSEHANFCRAWLDYMVEYQADGSLRPMLLESWEANEDATEWTLKVRQGVKWNNGDDFTAEDVVNNIRRWCDGTGRGQLDGRARSTRCATWPAPTRCARTRSSSRIRPRSGSSTSGGPDITMIVNRAD
jgi:peptide/nickel transport system substrate-binding protein